jgi:hypothetical protein
LLLYKHRRRIIPSPDELQLLLLAFVWETGPVLFWVLSMPQQEIAAMLNAVEVSGSLTNDQQAAVLLLKRKVDRLLFLESDFSCFHSYDRSWELARLIAREGLSLPVSIISFSLRHIREEVREAALAAVAERISRGELIWIAQLRDSSSLANFLAYLRLTLRREIQTVSNRGDPTPLREFSALQQLGRARTSAQTEKHWRSIASIRTPNRVRIFVEASVLAKTCNLPALLELCENLSDDEVVVALEAITARLSASEVQLLLERLGLWTDAGRRELESPRQYRKANALSEAVLRTSETRHLAQLR